MINIKHIRNFSIIAHINHGKSTLADRFIALSKNSNVFKVTDQILDSMEIERERGITIKSQCVTLDYHYQNILYKLNLIDTPGHTDFSYEVIKSLTACEGVILLIDITKGIQAQTIANYNKAKNNNLKIIIALNKIDLELKKKQNIKTEIQSILKINSKDIIEISAKKNIGIDNLIHQIITTIPPPIKPSNNKLECLIIDAWFNDYTGITCLVKIQNGIIKINTKIIISSTKKVFKIKQLGIFTPKKLYKNILTTGEIGFIQFGSKNIKDVNVGDMINLETDKITTGFTIQKTQPKIYANIYPITANDFHNLKTSISKLILNDSSINITPQNSNIFGLGFKCGFLGLLHLEITKERLEREYDSEIIITPPSISFKLITKNNITININNPSDMDKITNIKEIQEQIALTTIIIPNKYYGKINELCIESRGKQITINHINDQIILKYEIPFNEIIFNFFNKLQTLSNGFASLDYEITGYKKSDLNKLSILLNDKKIDALEFIIHKTKIYYEASKLINKIKKVIPRQLFEIKLQAAVGKKIISKATIKALKKNVLSKCYGGDITRKKKLLEKQKAGKKKMKKIGNIEIPSNAFIKIMNIDK